MEKMKKDDWDFVSGAKLKSTRYAKYAKDALLSKDYKTAIKNYEEAAEVITQLEKGIDMIHTDLFSGLQVAALKVNRAIYLSKAENLKKGGGLLKRLGFSFLFFIPAIFLLSSNITGNAIGNLNQTSSNWAGGILFAIGIIGTFVLSKKYRK